MTVEDKMRQVMELRKRQGWNGDYVKGETAFILSLVQAGGSPESIARETLNKDWPSRVAKFAGSPGYSKVMGL